MNNKLIIGMVVLLIIALSSCNQQESEFDQMKSAAQEYCNDPTDKRCVEAFTHMQGKDPQQKAQEKIGVVGTYANEDLDPMEFLSTWRRITKRGRGKTIRVAKRKASFSL